MVKVGDARVGSKSFMTLVGWGGAAQQAHRQPYTARPESLASVSSAGIFSMCIKLGSLPLAGTEAPPSGMGPALGLLTMEALVNNLAKQFRSLAVIGMLLMHVQKWSRQLLC